MCGFGGIINSEQNISRQQMEKIAGKVSFRGPDSCGIRVVNAELKNSNEGIHALFFNRLAIVDLDARSDQPFEDERYLLTFNGEIYNYHELKSDLEKQGIVFHTTSDTEVLFNLLRIHGADALPKLNGMFALFWLDKTEKKFFIARDRLGIKPLYYSHHNRTFSFSSEIDSIRRLLPNRNCISTEAVEMYLWMQFVPTPYSVIEGIHKLPPGNYLEGNINGTIRSKPKVFWDAYTFLSALRKPSGKSLENILKDSLQRQLQADVPLGLFLSAGVDSSVLAALVNKYFSKDNDVNFFTVQFEEATLSDESAEAKRYIENFNNARLHFNTIRINPGVVQSHIFDLYSFYDEPFADPAALLNWVVSEKAKQYVTVAVSGDGADELFWGYPRYNRWKKFTTINNIPGSGMIKYGSRLLPLSKITDNARFLLEKDPVKRHFNFFLPSGMRFKIRDHLTKYPIWALQNVAAIAERTDLPAILDLKTYLADAMLYKVDRSSMASSLEVRVPYLDNEMLEYALLLPLKEKSNPAFQHKAPLKELLRNLAPHYEINKPKKGFSFPLQKWLKENWKDLVLETVNKNDLEDTGIDAAPYLKLVSDFYKSRNNYFTDVWYIFNLALWIRKKRRIE